MKRLLPSLALLLAFGPWAGAQTLKITGVTTVDKYRMVRLTADGVPAGAAVMWDVSDEEKVDPEEIDNRYLFSAPPGKYRVKLRCVSTDDKGKTKVATARTTVTIVDPNPAPPVPPGPAPVPPAPPAPDDPLTRAMQLAYTGDLSPDKAASLRGFAALYKMAATETFLGKCNTWGEVYDGMKAAAESTKVAGKLPGVQAVVQNELMAKLPANRDDKITFDGRALAGTTFTKIATCLEGVR